MKNQKNIQNLPNNHLLRKSKFNTENNVYHKKEMINFNSEDNKNTLNTLDTQTENISLKHHNNNKKIEKKKKCDINNKVNSVMRIISSNCDKCQDLINYELETQINKFHELKHFKKCEQSNNHNKTKKYIKRTRSNADQIYHKLMNKNISKEEIIHDILKIAEKQILKKLR